ncbi:MAG: TadE/TadG family type IV pilus assembly protein [Nocardioides sp.]
MSRPDRTERGTSTLEVAGLAPLVLTITLALLYAGFALYGITATQTAARQAARAASLGDDPYAAADAALPGWLDPEVSSFPTGSGTTVRVRTDLPDFIPGTDLHVTREAVMP